MSEEAPKPVIESKKIVSVNIQKIESDMMGYLVMESLGGNAGAFEAKGRRFSCAGLRVVVNQDTGKLVTFLDAMEPYEGEEKVKGLMLRVAIGYDDKFKFNFKRIVEIGGINELSPKAQEVFNESVRQYNDKHGKI